MKNAAATPKTKRLRASDMTALLRPYASGWVALTPDERKVVASGPSIEEAHAAAARKGCLHPVLLQVIPPGRGFIGISL